MILADSSVWIDHFRTLNPVMSQALDDGEVLGHPMVQGEIAMGFLATRIDTTTMLGRIRQAKQASHREVMALVEGHRLFGLGFGYIDAHLLAATLLTDNAQLWTRDKRLHTVAVRFDVAFNPLH